MDSPIVDLSCIPEEVLNIKLFYSNGENTTLHLRLRSILEQNSQLGIESAFYNISEDKSRLLHFVAYSRDIVFSLVLTPFGDKDIISLWRNPPSLLEV